MLTFIWLIVWLSENTPVLHQWNNWLVSLIVCGIIDLLGLLEKESS